MAASSSSSLSSEKEVLINPYQSDVVPGPKGAYEARQARGGFYVRVDMPGVRPDGVKLAKYSDTRTVTFTGKAPKYDAWPCDSGDRVYCGYVVLDRDPTELDVEMTVKNGCLRLFFPGAEGTLHSLSSKNRARLEQMEDHEKEDLGSVIYWPCKNGSNKDKTVDDEPDVLIGTVEMFYENKGNITAQAATTPEFTHINPYLLHGAKGVYEKKLVEDKLGGCLYIRVDMPGLEEYKYMAAINDNHDIRFTGRKGCYLVFGGNGRKDHRLDEGGRTYHCCMLLQCTCCEIVGLVDEVKDGVFRLSFRKCST